MSTKQNERKWEKKRSCLCRDPRSHRKNGFGPWAKRRPHINPRINKAQLRARLKRDKWKQHRDEVYFTKQNRIRHEEGAGIRSFLCVVMYTPSPERKKQNTELSMFSNNQSSRWPEEPWPSVFDWQAREGQCSHVSQRTSFALWVFIWKPAVYLRLSTYFQSTSEWRRKKNRLLPTSRPIRTS